LQFGVFAAVILLLNGEECTEGRNQHQVQQEQARLP
jgi:hypothetical protein